MRRYICASGTDSKLLKSTSYRSWRNQIMALNRHLGHFESTFSEYWKIQEELYLYLIHLYSSFGDVMYLCLQLSMSTMYYWRVTMRRKLMRLSPWERRSRYEWKRPTPNFSAWISKKKMGNLLCPIDLWSWIYSRHLEWKIVQARPLPCQIIMKVDSSATTDSSIQYRELVGSLLYLGNTCRPDISFSVGFILWRFMENVSVEH